jgi:D-3-phosphoglycerate dehydrogenase
MKVVILDDYQDCVRTLKCFDKLSQHQVTLHHDNVKDLHDLALRLQDAEAVVLTRERTRITPELLDVLPNLKLVAQTGKVASHIDVAACHARGVTVTDGRGTGTATVELNLLLILASLRHLVPEVQRLQQGLWQGSLGRQLSGKKVGVLGFGRVGEGVCHLLKAFGAHPVVWGRESTLLKAKARGYNTAPSRAAFFQECDVLTLQLRLTPETNHFVSASDLALMKEDAVLVNVSRAELIEPGALVAALMAGRPGFAAVDVYENEPVLGAQDPLLRLSNCLCSPHLGFVERDNYEIYFGMAFDSINAFAAGDPQNVVLAELPARPS